MISKKKELSEATKKINNELAELPEPRVVVTVVVTATSSSENKPTAVITSTSILSTRAE